MLLLIAGYDLALSFSALVNGALGSSYALAETLVKTVPLLMTGLAVAFAFRAGVWNIGAEGQLLAGVLSAVACAPILAALPHYAGLPLMFCAGACAGALWGSLAAWMKTRRNVPEVVSTILLNFIALELVRYAVHGPLMEAAGQFPQSDALAQNLRLARILPPTRLHTGIVIVLAMALLLYFAIFHSAFGFRMRATASNPVAARVVAINVASVQAWALILSGALAGCAGVIELAGVSYRLYQNFSPGYGYLAIAVALMGRLHPLAIVASAFLFGALENGALAMQRQANVSAVVVYLIQGLVVLAIALAGALELKRVGLRVTSQ